MNLDEHVQLPEDGLDCLVPALVVLQELLHVSERVAKLRFMNQRQLVELGEDEPDLRVNLPAVIVYLVVRLLHQLLQLLVVLLPLPLRLDRQVLPVVELLVGVEDLFVQFFDFLEEHIEVLLNLLHLLNLLSVDILLTALRSRHHALMMILLL